MAKLTLRDIAGKLKEKLQQGATSFVQTLPPVQAYNAVKTMATPQFRQQAQNVANFGSNLSQQGANFGQQIGQRIQNTPQLRMGPVQDFKQNLIKKVAPTALGMIGSIPGEVVRSSAQSANYLTRLPEIAKAPLYTKGNILGTPQTPTKAGVAFELATTLPDITDLGKFAVMGGLGAGILKSSVDAKALKPFLPEIRNVSKILGNMDEIPDLTPQQVKAAESIVAKIRGSNAVAQINKLNKNPKDYYNSLRTLLAGAEDQILNPQMNIGFTAKALDTSKFRQSTKGVESMPVNNLEVPQSTKLQSQIPEQVLKGPLTSSIPSQKTYSSLPTEAGLKKIRLQQEKLAQKAANDDYKAWQQAVFKEAGATRTPYMQSKTNIENIGKSISKGTAPGGVKADELKDLSGFKAYTRDIYRNFKEVYGPKYENIKRVLLDPFDKSKGDLSRNYINWGKRINKEVEVGLGIKKGSKESVATQMFGEGKTSYEELVKDFGKTKADNIVKADQWFRKEYDQLLDEVNATMKRVYPNNPEKQIPKRQDYYRHFRDMGQGLSGLLNIFDSPSNIASGLAGTSEFTKPKSKWLSFAQKRLGGQTDIDAVGGFIDYVKAAEYNKNIDPHTAKFRALAEDLVAQTENDPKLNGFIEYLGDFAGDLAGKTNPADRFVQKVIPGGRKAMSVLNWLNSRVKANVILGNASSSIAQIFNVPQGIADAGPINSTKGLGLSIANLFGEATPINKSNFVTERYSGKAFDVFDRGIVNNTKKFAAWMTGALDELGTKYIWNSEYAKAISEGVENPIKYADDVTRSLVAGRGIGEVPLIQKSKLFQLAAPFQLEVANLWHVMGDWVGQKQFGKLATFFLASYIFNRAAEQVRGSDVSFDPIQASVDAYNAYKEEEDKKVGLMRAGGRLAGEVISNVPLGQSAAALYPEYGATVGDTKLPTREQFFGEGDPTRFGSGLLVAKGLQDPLYKVLPPFGGQQFKRTIEGIKATQKGFSESKTGRVRFPTEQTPIRQVQRAVFGEYSTPNARNYFDSESSVLGEKQSETFKRLLKTEPTKAQEYYNSIMNTRKNNKKQTSGAGSNSSLEVSAAENGGTTGSKTLEYVKDGKLLTVDLNKTFEYPTMDTSTALGKEAISRYKSEISSQVNKIYDAYKDGKITEQEASDYINQLSIQYDKTKKAKGPKKPKKITLKVSSYKAPKITIKKRSKTKIPTIKFKKPKKIKIVRKYTIK